MRRWLAWTCVGLPVVLAIVLACGGDGSSGEARRSQFLIDFSHKVALTTYQGFAAKSAALTTALAALADGPSADSLAAAQNAWREARAVWKHQDAFRIGPVEADNTHFKVDQTTDPQAIETLISGSGALDITAVESLGSNLKGMLAMEYLMFDAVGGNAAVLSSLDGSAVGLRRRAYLRSLGAVMQKSADALATAWAPPPGGGFADAVATAGAGSAAYGSQKEAIDALVNRGINASESAELKLSRLLGRDSGGAVRPELEESRRSDNSIADLIGVVESLRLLYQGSSASGDDVGLQDLLVSQRAELAARALQELSAAKSALEAIPPPLRTAVAAPGPSLEKVEAARVALDAVHSTWATEVAANLGVTLKFNDNDGD